MHTYSSVYIFSFRSSYNDNCIFAGLYINVLCTVTAIDIFLNITLSLIPYNYCYKVNDVVVISFITGVIIAFVLAIAY